MRRRLITSHSPYEGVAGFSARSSSATGSTCRARRPFRRTVAPPEGAYEQARLCLEIIGEALGRAGSGLEHVVRTNIYVTDRGALGGGRRAHGEAFRDVRPAATCVVAALLDPAWKVEIEAEAVLP